MYRYYKNYYYNIMYYYFDSINEFLNYIETHPTAREFEGLYLESFQKDKEWYGTDSLEEAIKLARYGYSEDFERFIDIKDKLEKFIKLSLSKKQQFNDYVGYAPDVKAYLEGNPLSMLNKINPIKKQVDIYFNTSYNCRTKTSQIYNRGVITLSIVEALEILGFNVNLNIFEMSYLDDEIHFSVYRLKDSNERMNIKKLYFPMCHNSWLRRLNLRLIEETPDIKRRWNNGYGTPAPENLIRDIMDLNPNDIVIAQPKEMNIEGYDIVDDANNMFKIINKKNTTKDYELSLIKKL